jgi:hypothetical protein
MCREQICGHENGPAKWAPAAIRRQDGTAPHFTKPRPAAGAYLFSEQ